MSNNYYRFKQFTIYHDQCAMKVGTDSVLLGAWVNAENCERILDIGTGSGIIAIMMAQKYEATIDAVEIDKSAYMQAIENIQNCPWQNRIKLFQQSLQDYCKNAEIKYDHIVCNPPFFVNSLKAQDKQRNTARHNDTLPQKDLIECSLKLLKSEGKLSLIMPYNEGSQWIAEAIKYGLFCNVKTNVKPMSHSPIKRILMEFSQIPLPCKEDTLIIKSGDQSFSEKYVNLTKDFYLNF